MVAEVAAFTIVRKDEAYLKLWVEHYGRLIGPENLYIVLDGDDWERPACLNGLNALTISDVPGGKGSRDRWASEFAYAYAANLLQRHRCVIRADVDEFLVLDPEAGQEFKSYLMSLSGLECISALGVDVIQNRTLEEDIDLESAPILEQRKHGVVTREFTKPCVVFKNVNWGAGFHRADRQKVIIDKNLFLFHLALFDFNHALERVRSRKEVSRSASLDEHVSGRLRRFREVEEVPCIPGDDVFEMAREQIAFPKPHGKVRTRPGFITKGNNVERGYLITIPPRFSGLI